MAQKEMDYLVVYIKDFIKNAQKHLENEDIAFVMIYDCVNYPCYKQFKLFKEDASKKSDVTDRILPVDLRSKLGNMYIEESRRWSEKTNEPEREIKFLPTFLDFKTHEILLVGIHTVKELRKKMKTIQMHR